MDLVYADDTRYPPPAVHPPPDVIQGLPTQKELDSYPRLFSWGELKDIISKGELDRLSRSKAIEARYEEWIDKEKEKWGGSAADYLTKARLPWGEANFAKGGGKQDGGKQDGEKQDGEKQDREKNRVSGRFGDNPNDADPGEYEQSAKADASDANGPKDSGFDTDQTPVSYAYVDDDKLQDRLEDEEHHPDDDTFLRFDPKDGLDADKYAVLLNDWPYCLPYGVRHYCVWSRVPIAHPKLVDYDPTLYDEIEQNGMHGFTGVIPVIEEESAEERENGAGANGRLGTADGGTTRRENPDADAPVGDLAVSAKAKAKAGWYAEDVKHAGTELRRWAGVTFEARGAHEVSNLVRGLWDPRGWECLFFVNPARLQSIPAYAHFHVFARRKTPEEIDVSEEVWVVSP